MNNGLTIDMLVGIIIHALNDVCGSKITLEEAVKIQSLLHSQLIPKSEIDAKENESPKEENQNVDK